MCGALAYNVKYVFLFTVAYWSANSIISQQVLSGYIFVLTGSNEPVGIVKGIQGLTQLLFALPAGYAADRLRRDRILGFAGVLGIVASLLTAFAFQIGHLPLLYVAFALWGAFAAFQSPAMEALFADSVPMGQRSMPFMLKHLVLNAALVIGPSCAILLFLHYGDVWELPVLRPVVLFGTFVAMLSMGVLFLFNDDLAYENQQHQLAVERQLRSIARNFDPELSEYTIGDVLAASGRERDDTSYSDAQSRGPSEISKLIMAPSRTNMAKNAYQTTTATATEASGVGSDVDTTEHTRPSVPLFCGLDPTYVPYMLFLSDFIISNGAGMTINFFPLFFYKEFGLSPVQVQWLFVAQPVCIGVGSLLSQLVSRLVGRMPVIAATRAVGTVCLLLMSQLTDMRAQCALFLVRAAMMNCTEPLRRSLLMDFVPRSQRARWNSLEGLSMFSWAGSAVIGGFLVEAHGYRFCFLITSLVYIVGVLLELMLIPITRFAVETSDAAPSLSVPVLAPATATTAHRGRH